MKTGAWALPAQAQRPLSIVLNMSLETGIMPGHGICASGGHVVGESSHWWCSCDGVVVYLYALLCCRQ